MTGILKN